MEELIAKRYIKAFSDSVDAESFTNASVLFDVLTQEFSNTKFKEIVYSPSISNEIKLELLLASVKNADSKELNNLISLLVEHGRIEVIPAIASGMKKEIARINKNYTGKVFSNSEIEDSTISGLSAGLSKKVNANIVLEFVKDDFDGIKVEVEDLGLEVQFSNNRLNSQLVNHILKAI
ncbi:MAG: F0F1 ATP synthase subunit delta [Campylobacterota bacterium]|nr:F0F1 ATP synthase subunit delta [Campylobacterota bacterium]